MVGVNKRIRAFRKLKGYTQLELAEEIGVSVAVLGAVERGTRQPDLLLLEKIGTVLSVDLDEFLQIKQQE